MTEVHIDIQRELRVRFDEDGSLLGVDYWDTDQHDWRPFDAPLMWSERAGAVEGIPEAQEEMRA